MSFVTGFSTYNSPRGSLGSEISSSRGSLASRNSFAVRRHISLESFASVGSCARTRRSTSGVSLHLGTLQQICLFEKRKETYSINDCVIAAKLGQMALDNISNDGPELSPLNKNRTEDTSDISVSRYTSTRTKKDQADREYEDNNNGPQILTPFQAVKDFKREAPAYWINCAYVYDPKTQTINMTVRQTGVLPEMKSKLTMNITVKSGASKKQVKQVVLKRSDKDNSFKSSSVQFRVNNELNIRESFAKFEIFSHSFLSKKKVAVWQFSLEDCSNTETRARFEKVKFIV